MYQLSFFRIGVFGGACMNASRPRVRVYSPVAKNPISS